MYLVFKGDQKKQVQGERYSKKINEKKRKKNYNAQRNSEWQTNITQIPVTEIMQIRDKPYKKLQSMEFQIFLIKIQDIYK